MKSLHQIIIIAIGIILGFGWANGAIYQVHDIFGKVSVNWKYLAPVVIYLVALVLVGLVRLTISTGESDNGTVETTTEKTGKA